MMFNRKINDDLAVVQEIVNESVARASVPGTESYGNAGGAYSALSSGLIPASAQSGAPAVAHFGESGVDENGVEFHPVSARRGRDGSGGHLFRLMAIDRTHWQPGDELRADDLEGAFIALETVIGDGGPAPPSGAGGTSQTVVVTSSSLAPGASDATKSAPLGAGALVGRVQTSVPAWIRLYPTAADRLADAARGMSDDPGEGVVVAMEFVTSATRLTLNAANAALFDPEIDGWQLNIVNLSGAAAAVATTFTIRSI